MAGECFVVGGLDCILSEDAKDREIVRIHRSFSEGGISCAVPSFAVKWIPSIDMEGQLVGVYKLPLNTFLMPQAFKQAWAIGLAALFLPLPRSGSRYWHYRATPEFFCIET